MAHCRTMTIKYLLSSKSQFTRSHSFQKPIQNIFIENSSVTMNLKEEIFDNWCLDCQNYYLYLFQLLTSKSNFHRPTLFQTFPLARLVSRSYSRHHECIPVEAFNKKSDNPFSQEWGYTTQCTQRLFFSSLSL